MNLFYTGLGIARSLGERGVPVIGLSAHRSAYGNYSRYLRMVRSADSSKEPEVLLRQLLDLGRELGHRSVLFPTRDSDLVLLDRFRHELEPHFLLVMPGADALERCLNKWETYRYAMDAGVPVPRSWLIQSHENLRQAADQVTYPCVLKPLSAHHWRTADNWELVGARKAVSASSREELVEGHAAVARADRRMLLQETVPGGDDCLVIAACYMDRQSTFRAGFNAQKLVQIPTGFGTGCIVQSANRPELFERTIALLRKMQFSGVAEVEYKWDAAANDYKLIEVNPRPWDQHRLGAASGVDLIYLAYCDFAGLQEPTRATTFVQRKWIAEDTYILETLRLLWRRDPGLGALLRQARGERIYAIWSWRDPLPFLAYAARLIPTLVVFGFQAIGKLFGIGTEPRQKAAVRATP
jgi:predicted ATP-grasp superfamily ATP-dependent carboligase